MPAIRTSHKCGAITSGFTRRIHSTKFTLRSHIQKGSSENIVNAQDVHSASSKCSKNTLCSLDPCRHSYDCWDRSELPERNTDHAMR